MKDDFRFIAPVSIEKSMGKDGQIDNMIIAGIASTSSQDFDGEFMNPKGFDVEYFKNYGFANWAHQSAKDPLSIIGRPNEVKIDQKKNELFVKVNLFKSSEKARQVYKLGEILEAEGHNLAFSIEGKVTKRDKDDPRKVLAAKITGVAITPTPKNNDSVASIVKGLDDNDFDFIKGTMSAYEDTEDEEQEKAMGTQAVAPLTRESVDGSPKITVEKLTKSQVMTVLREDLPNTSDEMLEEVYKLVLTIEKSVIMEKPEISPEALNEAYKKLGVEKGVDGSEESSTEEKPAAEAEAGESGEAAAEENNNEESPEESAEESAEEAESEEGSEENSEEGDDNVEKSTSKGPSEEAIEASLTILKSAGYEVFSPSEEQPEEEEKSEEQSEEDNAEKGIVSEESSDDISTVLKTELGSLSKGFDEKFNAVGTIFKGLEARIIASEETNEKLQKALDVIGNNSQGKKSVTAYIEKGVAGAEGSEGKAELDENTLSLSIHKDEILKKADDMCGLSKGEITDGALANSVALFEQSNYADPTLIKAMKDAGITLVK